MLISLPEQQEVFCLLTSTATSTDCWQHPGDCWHLSFVSQRVISRSMISAGSPPSPYSLLPLPLLSVFHFHFLMLDCKANVAVVITIPGSPGVTWNRVSYTKVKNNISQWRCLNKRWPQDEMLPMLEKQFHQKWNLKHAPCCSERGWEMKMREELHGMMMRQKGGIIITEEFIDLDLPPVESPYHSSIV